MDQEREQGFTLIEMVIGMAIGLIILAGLTALFVSYNDTGRAVASRTERMTDLYLASHILQAEIRQSISAQSPTRNVLADLTARGVTNPASYPTNNATFAVLPYWHAASKTLTYQDLEGNVGIVQYQRTSNDRVYWLRPGASYSTFQELIRDLDTTNGMTVSSGSGVVTVTLSSSYVNENDETKTLSLTFKSWPRN
ncbi:prepilin-type N-terminal cleavage/methylation domain-containing protein [Mariprofundus ferrinatatus]|uniref:Prepilin-type N-terminal cleavage/methylation domain-containing protein n=2 Tax=Mariprofundus ferrinatatus TaxID=1921087 RepID=A0A2K8L5T2_9PROT|nr:prepilin-type N-terminal cleavage/methylation domain-containing protein [Mariprofundus ferrinatatus]